MTQLQRLVITPTQREKQQIFLTDSQQHYLVKVLRLTKGNRFIAMDGEGSWWLSELAENLTQATIIESIDRQTELPLAVTLIVAMPKGNGLEQIISGATELGVTSIIPVKSDRTLLNPSPQKVQRWRRIAQESAEQSERQIVPTIHDPLDFTTSLKQQASQDYNTVKSLGCDRYICIARGDIPHLLNSLTTSELLQNTNRTTNYPPNSIIIATGPEGGWTPSEIAQAQAAEFQPVTLGKRILRSITAPIVALSIISSILEAKISQNI
ncbi:MAG TPA: 16S rRNA (uracil(1498)-N(3))-methyltransferase [Cyanobacteria bacterium UBA11149]|nr:16S rRNA (uracil(1498)-N(3))-methyltransferase [Cyanobacteria bacterium UBA11367]HBE57856.1 16S rRNA (uracil(1498)-N(3))-methyltransferase [Cyanobacteria bacterium UBA11366]HBK61965.1 16S rRNA (uracil(1498)-N(3))-methyltransferase [Cyanobacteria bacterium UBA11166]HBR76534.1 16S rRNA (uracil(1498)-N(3))-methyltransferase [Cyanobacteria bacterium UBA11159]HBS67657.1 16S rRNA (uracil(1498)-N(3))-methyltransferase [Cyanobacteria bacterium UBA11153]HBW87679.1 16S rRNA (uracil(1498)-N(3))-methyl